MKRLAVLATLACLAVLVVLFWPKPRPAANIDALRGVLEKSALESMPAPDVTSDKLRVTCGVAGMEEETARVIKFAKEAGGTAFKSKSGSGETEILASIPSAHGAAFRQAVTGTAPKIAATPEGAAELIDIIVSGSSSSQ